MKKINEFKMLLECQNIFFYKMDYFLSSFANEVEIKYVENHSHIEQIILLKNASNNKNIYYSVSYGTNIESNLFNAFRFYIQKNDKTGTKTSEFSILDFNKHLELKNEIHWFYLGEIDLVRNVNSFLIEINNLLLNNEILIKVLYTGEWFEFPVNMEPYK